MTEFKFFVISATLAVTFLTGIVYIVNESTKIIQLT
uniref:Uncharacterized protein n=1 Tax=Nitrosopumivirus cobalaminus TaxID=3158414 RepID=A0AAU7N445_9VIRU